MHQGELSLERFQEKGVNAEYEAIRYDPSIKDKLIRQEQLQMLILALQPLTVEKRHLALREICEVVNHKKTDWIITMH